MLERVAAMSNWRARPQREGWGMGLGFARYKNTGAWAAVVAEVEARERVFCRRLWIAGDVGEVVNPDGVANQFEGGAIHGTSVALLEEVRFDRRRVTSDGWDEFPILRFPEVPKVAVDIIARPDQPFLGAGEASMAPTIAAIAGGIHQALGNPAARAALHARKPRQGRNMMSGRFTPPARCASSERTGS